MQLYIDHHHLVVIGGLGVCHVVILSRSAYACTAVKLEIERRDSNDCGEMQISV